ncbi:MAG: hypothetical protein HND58_04405 [Planctomycetota bacterium]|nr:MAG: hypothetical protein HND58_04405 [Planctomycetota bacterium]
MTVDGPDYSLVRHYTGAPDYVSNSNRALNGPALVGEGWTMNAFMYLVPDPLDSTRLLLRSWPLTVQYPFTYDMSEDAYLPLGTSTLRIDKSFVWIDGEYWPTWKLHAPREWAMHFVRQAETGTGEFDEDDAGSVADQLDGHLYGVLLHSSDAWNNYRVYSYYKVVYDNGGTDVFTPRLREIHLNGSPYQFGDARVRFTWHFDDDGGALTSIVGQLDEVEVVRLDENGDEVVTQRVDYSYGAELGSALSPDVAKNGTGHDESTELVQVATYTLVDSAPSGVDPYRVQVRQYRYHDGAAASSTGDERLDVFGLQSQLKSVIEPQQIEYYAERRTAAWSAGSRVLDAAEEMLGMDDDESSSGWSEGGNSPEIVDFAAKIVHYDSNGLVERQHFQAACGCSGSSQSVRMAYELEEYDISPADDRGRSLIITESVDSGSGYEPYRRYYIDTTLIGSNYVPRVTSRATAELDSSGDDERIWATESVYDTTSLLLEEHYTTSALASYGRAGGGGPTISREASAGHVTLVEYNGDGRIIRAKHRKGESAPSAVTRFEIDYGSTDETSHLITETREFNGLGSGADYTQTTTYDYRFYQVWDDVADEAVDSSAISAFTVTTEGDLAAENGSSAGLSGHSMTVLLNTDGKPVWVKHFDNSIDYMEYEPRTGTTVKIAHNVDPTGGASGSPNPPLNGSQYGISDTSAWGRYADGGFAITTRTNDLLGRMVSSTSPTGVSTYLIRDIAEEDSAEFGMSGSDVLYFRTLRFPHLLSDDSTDGPVAVSWRDAGNSTLRSSGFELDLQGSYDPPTPSDVDWAAELSRSTATLSYAGVTTATKRWLDLDETGRVAQIDYEYDGLGRRVAVTDPNGTLRRTVFDVLDRPIEGYVGDSSGDLLVQEMYYDSGTQQIRTGIGNSNLTVLVQHTGEDGTLADDERETINYYDWHDRLIATENPESPHQAMKYDNMDRPIVAAVYSSLPTIDLDGVDIDDETNRGAYSETFYSQRGLPYRSRVAIDPSQATMSFLESDTWYDESGRRLASDAPNGPASVVEYDGLGRTVRAFITDRAGDTASNGSGSYEDITDLSDDNVIEESTIVFRDDTLPELAYTTKWSNAVENPGEIGLDDGITTFAGSVYDDASRLIATINWGTNTTGFQPAGSGGIPTVPSTVPDRDSSPWDDTIITEQSYNSRGLTETVTDPEGKLTRYLYDDANRRIAVVENYVSTAFGFGWDATAGRWEVTGGLSGSTPDVNRVTSYAHDLAGNVLYQTAHLPPSGGGSEDVQVTEYVYGVTAVTSSPGDTDSLITSYSLLKEVRYPNESTGEPGTTDEYKVKYAYNQLGELRSVVDQNGTTHVYSRDNAGRATLDWVSAFGTDVDGQGTDIDDTVNGIQIFYDTFGRVELVESLDSTPAVVNGVKFGYNSLWQVEDVFQDPNSAVTETGGTPTGDTMVVRYGYSEDATNNHSRLTSMTYPDGSQLNYEYGATTGDTDDLISRVTTLSLGSGTPTDIVNYDHVGLGMFAEVDYAVPDVQLDRTASHDGKRAIQGFSTQTAGLYPGWDRFGRVVRHTWVDGNYTQHGSTAGYPDRPSLFETTHTYDRASNRLTRYDERPGAQMPNWDFEYEYDDLDRLVTADRGDIDGSTLTTGIGTQEWTLDMLGNWSTWEQDLNGDGSFNPSNSETEDRGHNAANEITSLDIQGLTGSPFTQHRDKAGNWTRNKRSAASNIGYTHDAWNRLVKVRQLQTIPASTLGEYEYNGLHWRTVKRTAGDAERRMFYSASWQLLEERFDSDTSDGGGVFAEEKCSQTIWGLRDIDDAVLRRTDTDQDYNYADAGERTDYFITDPQFSMVAVVSDTAALQERVAYSAYGEARHHFPFDLDGDGDVDSTDTGLISITKTIDQAGYNPDADIDRNGTVNSIDYIAALGAGKAALAKGLVSDPSGPNSPIGYDGYLFNAETKLYTVRFRHYEPVTGRWIERDSLGYVDGQNGLEFVRSSPIHFVDPLGLASESAGCAGCDSEGDGRNVSIGDTFWGLGDGQYPQFGSDLSKPLESGLDEINKWAMSLDPSDVPGGLLDALKAVGANDNLLWKVGEWLNKLKGLTTSAGVATFPYNQIVDIMTKDIISDLKKLQAMEADQRGVVPILTLDGECCEMDKKGKLRWIKHSMQLWCTRDKLWDLDGSTLSDPSGTQYEWRKSYDPNTADALLAAADCANNKDNHFKCPSGTAGQGALLPLPESPLKGR